MRWEALFADLTAQAEALERIERDVDVADRTRIETGSVALRDRLAATVGRPVRLRCAGGVVVAGRLAQVGTDWLLMDEGSAREALVPLAALLVAGGVRRRTLDALPAGSVASRLGVRHVLRGIARDRSAALLHLVDGTTISGTIDRVGADFVEVAVHAAGEARRRADVVDVAVVAVGALAAVRRATT
ncbi:MAG TPA: hypothetical protein VKQ07_03995 [Jatrophihabitantaceae bacterium]|nr:hypothetical protein [Jatrophihabitantaceae bacterium]